MTADRTPCCVPYCRRSTKHSYSEWICSVHWPAVPKRLKRRLSLFKRRYRQRYGNTAWHLYPAGSDNRIGAVRVDRLIRKVWAACKKAAIESAAGI